MSQVVILRDGVGADNHLQPVFSRDKVAESLQTRTRRVADHQARSQVDALYYGSGCR